MKNRIQETQRSRNLRVLKKNVYISCEGDTEEAYLLGLKKQFSSKANIKISNSKKTAAKDVVKNLITKYKAEYNKNDLKYCIFDCDENTDEDLINAKKLADKAGIKIIFSNPCFEIWLLWHYETTFSVQESREKLKKQIEKLTRANYWTCKDSPNLYELTKENFLNAQMNCCQRKEELIKDDIPAYSRESNPYSIFDKLYDDLVKL